MRKSLSKTILITGATDGLGLDAAKRLVFEGHHVLIHGRDESKLDQVQKKLSAFGQVDAFCADFAEPSNVSTMAGQVLDKYTHLDVLINNAGVYKTSQPISPSGVDVRIVVNLFAPVFLTKGLLSIIPSHGRVVNLSSAAQSPVDLKTLTGEVYPGDMPAYAQSKLALTIWTKHMAEENPRGPLFVAVNPASFLGTKMVKEGWGMPGKDITIGSDIIVRAALSDEFEGRSGDYFDNDIGQFAAHHPDVLDPVKRRALVDKLTDVLGSME